MAPNKVSTSKNIYYLTADFPPDNNAGRARATAFVKALSESGCNVEVLSNKAAQKVEHAGLLRLPVKNPQSDPRFLRRLLRELILVFFAWLRLLFVPKRSTIVITSPPFFFSFIFFLLPRRKNVRHILDIRDLYPDVFVDAGLILADSWQHRLLSRLERRAYARSDLILTVCGSLAEQIRKRAPGIPVEVIVNGYSDGFASLNCQAENGRSHGQFTIIAHGNFGRFQDIELIHRLAKATCNMPIQYRFIGFGAKLKQLESLPNVWIEEAKPQHEMPAILQQANLGLSFRTSDETGRHAIPVKVLEFLGAYLPSLVVPIMPDLEELERAGAICQFEATQLDEILAFLRTVTQETATYDALVASVTEIRHLYSRSIQAERAAELILNHSEPLWESE